MATAACANDLCYAQAAQQYSVAPEILQAIAHRENPDRDPHAIHWNTDGTYDYGWMQINSKWVEWSPVIRDLWPNLSDPCTNIMAGAWILSGCIREYGYNWKAIGCYHSRTPSKRDRYAKEIAAIIIRKRNDKYQATALIGSGDITMVTSRVSKNSSPNVAE